MFLPLRTAAAVVVTAVLASTLVLVARVEAASAPVSVVVDGFNRADSASLGQTETTQQWSTWAGSARLVSQQAEAPGGGYTLAVVDSGTATGAAALSVPMISSEFWLIVRASDNANYWRFGRWQGGTYLLQQVSDNNLGSPALVLHSTVAPATGDRLSCQLAAGLSCSVNGTAVVSTTDGFNAAATRTGFAAGGAAATRFDDVLVTLPEASPDLRTIVTAGSASVDTGAPVSWTAAVTNTGNQAATAAVVTVHPPTGLADTTVTTAAGPCTGGSGSWTCSVGTLAPGAGVSVAVDATGPAQPATLTLSATAAAQEADANPADNTSSAAVTVRASGTVASDGFSRPDATAPGTAESGQPWTTWTGTARIAGQAAEMSGGYASAVIDSGTAAGTASVTVPAVSSEFWLIVRGSNSTNYWRFGRWQGGNYRLQKIVDNAVGSATVMTSATLGAANGDRLSCQAAKGLSCSVNGVTVASTGDTFNSTAGFTGFAASGGTTATRFDNLLVTTPQPAPDLRVAVEASAASVEPGGAVAWTATITNPGARVATSATVTVDVPTTVTGVKVSTTAGSCGPNDTGWTCAVGNRPVGSSLSIMVTATAPSQPATLTLTTSAASEEEDADFTDNTASASVTTPPGAVAVDGFSRADAASLERAESGQAWATWSGSPGVAARQAETSGGYAMAVVDTTTAGGTASVRVPVTSSEYWLVVRGSNASNYWRFGRWQSGSYQLQQIVNNSLGSPAVTVLSAPAPAAGDRLSCYMTSVITCSVNDTAVVRTTDSFNASARFVGFAGNGVTATRFDDLLVTTPQPGPDLQVAVDAGAATVQTGAPVSWTGTITNGGTLAASGTQVTVTPPSGLTGTSVASSEGPCSAGAGTWTCHAGTQAAGTSFTVTVNATAPAEAATLTLTMTAGSAEPDIDAGTNSAGATITVRTPPPPGTVAVDGFGRTDSSGLGETETGQAWTTWVGTSRLVAQQAEATGASYTVAVLDSGTASGTAALTVTQPSPEFWMILRGSNSSNYWRFGRWQGGTYQLQQIVNLNLGSPAVATSGSVMPAAGDRLSCKLGSGIACSVNGTVVVSTDDGFNATARYTGFGAGAGTAARVDDLSVSTPPPGPDLVVSVSPAASSVQTEAPVSWTATVRNDGTQTATAAVVTVTPPAGLTGTSVTSTAGSCLPTGAVWSCAVGNRTAGSTLSVTVNATAPASAGTVTLDVSAAAQEADTEPGSNAASASIVVTAPAAPGSVVTDSFGRPDSTILGTSDTGQPWSTLSGSFGVDNGAAAPGGTGTNIAAIDPGWQYGTYEVTVTAGAAPGAFAVIVRGRDVNNHVRIGPDATGYYRMWKVVNGSPQALAISLRRADLAPRNGDVIRIVNRPDDGLFVSVNGVHLLDAGDQALLPESRFGLVASATGVRFDSVWISQVMSSGVTTTDSFNRSDGTELADRQTEAGTRYTWHASYGWRSLSNRANIPGYGFTWVDTTSELSDLRVEIHTPQAEAFLVFRYSETGDYYHFGHNPNGNYIVERVVGGVSTGVSMLADRIPAAGDLLDVRQSVDGRIECLVNGVRVADFVDTTFNRRTTGYGLEGNNATFDTFAVTAK